jgi:hypothetical protein
MRKVVYRCRMIAKFVSNAWLLEQMIRFAEEPKPLHLKESDILSKGSQDILAAVALQIFTVEGKTRVHRCVFLGSIPHLSYAKIAPFISAHWSSVLPPLCAFLWRVSIVHPL